MCEMGSAAVNASSVKRLKEKKPISVHCKFWRKAASNLDSSIFTSLRYSARQFSHSSSTDSVCSSPLHTFCICQLIIGWYKHRMKFCRYLVINIRGVMTSVRKKTSRAKWPKLSSDRKCAHVGPHIYETLISHFYVENCHSSNRNSNSVFESFIFKMSR